MSVKVTSQLFIYKRLISAGSKLLPLPRVLFGRLQYELGSESGAREVFGQLVTDLVGVRYPTANEVAGPGGSDWGIDTYVGKLDEDVVVWQSKFFLDWKGEDQRGQVRNSFNEVIKKAEEKGFKVSAWRLCVPCILPPDEQRWFDDWSGRMRRKYKIPIVDIWNGVELRRQLMQDDASAVLKNYFPPSADAAQESEPLVISSNLEGMATALFVRQLEEAGYVETDAARGYFFAAEALARDLVARESQPGIAALQEMHLEIQSLWEAQFNASLDASDASGRMAGLIQQVLKDAGNCPDPEGLKLKPAHRKGVMHRLVENAKAGWVRHWREVAESHEGISASDVVESHLSTVETGNKS